VTIGKIKRGLIYTAGLTVALILLDVPHLHQPKINLNKPSVIKVKHATWEEKNENKKIGRIYAQAGWGWQGREWLCLHDLWVRESRWDHRAQNPKSSAFGIAQRIGETSRDPRVQILKGLRYIDHRHKTPCKALSYHFKHGNY
jgi:hypothetical protein